MNLENMIWSNYGKLVVLLLFATVVLQGYQLMFLIKLPEYRKVHTVKNENERTAGEDLQKSEALKKIMEVVVGKLEEAHISDASGSYFIIPNVMEAEVDHSEYTVTLCSQTTVNHLHYLKDLSQTWAGPISVSVFTLGEDVVHALYTILYMHTCYASVRKYVKFHVMYPIRFPPVDLHRIFGKNIDCNDDIGKLLHESEKKLNYDYQVPYPHNILRNIAISNTESPYIFLIDIDMVPSRGLGHHFKKFVQRQSLASIDTDKADEPKLVYVVPAFESKVTETMSKESLLKEWDAQNVRPFYSEVCWKCQKVTDYDKWKQLPYLPFLDTGYILDWEDPWEPFYIARKVDLPLYDGRFKQYGFNRISQVCELHVAGYRFAVLNKAFVVHREFKEIDKFHEKKEIENLKNKELFQIFKLDLKDRYPDVTREC